MRDLHVYIRMPLLIVLVGTFYWRDFLAFWQTAISTGWMVFALAIMFLILVFLFQRKNALKTLISISENRINQGAGLVLLALVLYVVGSYTPYVLWLHLCSLVLFIAGYLVLVIDFRIPRMLFLPLVAMLFVVPPIGVEVSEVQNLPALVILHLSVDAVIVLLVAYIAGSLKWQRMKMIGFLKQSPAHNNETNNVYCPFCRSDIFNQELFCYHCGRQRLSPKLRPFKFFFTKFLVLLLVVLVLSFAYLPTFSLADGEASLMSFTPHGVEEQTIIPAPEGWNLERSERLVDYEREHFEDFAVIDTYVLGGFSKNKSYVQLEIGSGTLYMTNGWQISGWQRSSQPIALTELVRGQYVVLQRGDNSINVLYWTMPLMFRVGSAFSTKNVGVSVFSNFTEFIAESKVVEVLAEFTRISISIINLLDFVNLWTFHFHTLSEVYVRFRDVFFTGVGVAAVLVFAGRVRAKDEKLDRLAENAFVLMEAEAKLLVTISGMKRRRFFGKELFDAYRQNEESEVDLKEFYEKLRKFSIFGLIGNDYVLKNGEFLMVWKRMFL